MRNQPIGTTIGAILIAVVFFVLGHLIWGPAPNPSPSPLPSVAPTRSPTPPPPDGNPIGFHLYGAAKIDYKQFSVANCNNKTCTLRFSVTVAKAGATTKHWNCSGVGTSKNCLHFLAARITESSEDKDNHTLPNETVNADGRLEIGR